MARNKNRKDSLSEAGQTHSADIAITPVDVDASRGDSLALENGKEPLGLGAIAT
jgi:hypothetical protein